jgi:hypothetical protein
MWSMLIPGSVVTQSGQGLTMNESENYFQAVEWKFPGRLRPGFLPESRQFTGALADSY